MSPGEIYVVLEVDLGMKQLLFSFAVVSRLYLLGEVFWLFYLHFMSINIGADNQYKRRPAMKSQGGSG